MNNCISNCSNYGVCKLIGDQSQVLECICDPDYTGSKCEVDKRPCSSLPCLNYEKCENVFDLVHFEQTLSNVYSDFKCHCKENCYGKRIETNMPW